LSALLNYKSPTVARIMEAESGLSVISLGVLYGNWSYIGLERLSIVYDAGPILAIPSVGAASRAILEVAELHDIMEECV
jgi:hypothetical protein